MELANNRTYEFISLFKIENQTNQVYIEDSQIESFEKVMTDWKIIFKEQKNIDLPIETRSLKSLGSLCYDRIYNSDTIFESIEKMAALINANPDSKIRTKIWSFGNTSSGRPIYAIRIGLKSNNMSTVPITLADSGIHGNEWITPLAGHKIIEQLLFNESSLRILDKMDIIFAACVNRDGYDASIRTKFSLMYGRKNHQPSVNGDCVLSENVGTNINRNFDWHWYSTNSREDPCNYNYRGDYPNSAIETQALISLMKLPNVKFYYTIHSFGNLILYPYGNFKIKSWFKMHQVAAEGQLALRKAFNQEYVIGSTYEILYLTTGASKDYAAGVAGIDISLILEIGGDAIDFEPRAESIPDYAEMGWCAFEPMVKKVIEILHL